MNLKTKSLIVAVVWILTAGGNAFAQAGGYGGQWWSGQQGMMAPGGMMHQGQMMVPGNMMGQGGMMRPGSMMGQLTQQQREEMKKIAEEFFPKFGELQGQMKANQQRMQALFGAETLDQSELDSVAKQMGDLMAEMFKLRVQHMDRMRSVSPQELRQQMRQRGAGG